MKAVTLRRLGGLFVLAAVFLAGAARADVAPTISISDARMLSSHELRVTTTTTGDAGPVSISAILQGATLTQQVSAGPGTTSEAFVFDFAASNVPRFTRSQVATFVATFAPATGGTAVMRGHFFLPLPVVTVHGIHLGSQWDEHFPLLEAGLNRLSAAQWGANSAYQPVEGAPAPPYPTLFAFRWESDGTTLADGASELRDYVVNTVRASTWADKVVLIGHSRGANLVRAFLSTYVSADGTNPYCDRAALACTPATGSIAATLLSPGAWQDLLPVWPWFRAKAGKPFAATPPNPVLDALNAQPLPSGVPVVALYGYRRGKKTTQNTATGTRSATEAPGDGFVTTYSARGIPVVPNRANPNRLKLQPVVPSMAGAPVEGFAFAAGVARGSTLHGVFLGQASVQSFLYRWLSPPLPPSGGSSQRTAVSSQ